MEQFIVTGGAGLIGSNVVAGLNARGIEDILVVDHLNHPGKEKNLAGLRYRRYLDRGAFREAVRAGGAAPAATLFHLGACSSTTETDQAYLDDNNTGCTRELCAWCLANGTRFIYASSAATYGDGELGYADDDALTPRLRPLNLYGWSKQKFDCTALREGWLDRIAGLKYFNVFGPGEGHKGEMRSVIHKAYHQIRETGAFSLFRSHRPDYADGGQVRDFVYVKDAVAVTLFFHDHPEVSGLFNCGTGRARSWVDLLRAIYAAMGREPVITFTDMPAHLRDKYQYFTEADTRKLRAAGCRHDFLPLEDAVADYVRNYLDRQP
ncbi:MAG: ADP-glyceromanno-heptose 6-epimerase [Verrucomicrobiota bacterium]|jgi:ADP-L-glycero-D-manno-heptose 6-epimerase|nr:ADP-glyceromanno-heptose 6-epimerase [Verrucomicrobiota bacterium]